MVDKDVVKTTQFYESEDFRLWEDETFENVRTDRREGYGDNSGLVDWHLQKIREMDYFET